MLHSEQLEELYRYIEVNDIKPKKSETEDKDNSDFSSIKSKIRSVRNLLETKDFNSENFDNKKFYRNSSIFSSEKSAGHQKDETKINFQGDTSEMAQKLKQYQKEIANNVEFSKGLIAHNDNLK